MSIASEITRISGNIADAYTALDAKGATLPAEGSQNSANLADTIDTISAGGGTPNEYNWVRPSSFQNVDDVIASYDESKPYSQWTVLQDGYTDVNTIFGYVLSSECPSTIYIRVSTSSIYSSDISFQASTGTLTQISSDSSYKIYSYTFSGDDKWIVLAARITGSGSVYFSLDVNDDFYGSSSFYCFYKYTHTKKLGEQQTITSFFDGGYGQGVTLYGLPYHGNCDDFSLTNIKIGCALSSEIMVRLCQSTYDSAKLLSYFTSDTYINSTGVLSSDSYMDSILSCKIMPFKLDFSSITSATGLSKDNPLLDRQTIKEIYITLPAQDFYFGNLSEAAINTKEAWEYMATHAPTVSGKRILCRKINISIMGGTNSTAYTTLIGKGWSFYCNS